MPRIRFALACLLIAVGGFESARSATAQTSLESGVQTALERELPGLTELRHHLHQHPELSNREVETAALVAERLRALGLEVQDRDRPDRRRRRAPGRPARARRRRARRHGRAAGDRGDRPAVSLDSSAPTFLGQEVGVSHACGHDIHTAVRHRHRRGAGGGPHRTSRHRGLLLPARRGRAAAGRGGRRGADARRRRASPTAPAGGDLRPSRLRELAEASRPRSDRSAGPAGPAFAAVDHFVTSCAASSRTAPTRTRASTRS